ncbi:hypothetical protein M2138_000461 [Dysgonomonadaceae bacterium PH5-43]|nr:hypothetical protein [Dysgonomonadaceae bacterium PH5-43]
MKRLLFFIMLAFIGYNFASAEQVTTSFVIEASGSSDVNNKIAIPKLNLNEEWTVTATTFYKGTASGYWGSRLFSLQSDDGTILDDGFEFYLRPDNMSNGQLGFNNVYGSFNKDLIAWDTENGTEFIFVISCDGESNVSYNISIDGEEWSGVKPLNLTKIKSFDYVQAAQNYDVMVDIEYNPPFLSVTPASISFKAATMEDPAEGPYSIAVVGSDAFDEKFSYDVKTIKGSADNFYIDFDESFSTETGGNLSVFFMAEEPVYGEQHIIITFSRGTESFDVELKGLLLPKSPVEEDTWYRVQFYSRTGYVLTDNGAEELLTATMYDAANESQLWKFVKVSEVEGIPNYKMVSKTGNNIGYNYPIYEVIDEKEVMTSPGRFTAVAESNNTFKFDLCPDGNWQILWNEYEYTTTTGEDKLGGHINKVNVGSVHDYGFTAYNYLPDVGSGIKIFKADEEISIGLPKFSNEEESYYYYMQFKRVSSKIAIKSTDDLEIPALTQATIDEEDNDLFLWRFFGDIDECTIVDVNGNAFGVGSTQIVDISEANYYKFIPYGVQTWSFQNLTTAELDPSAYQYINDFGGNGNAVGQWSASDNGAELYFTLVKTDGVNISAPDAIEGEVVSTSYFTLQGVQLGSKPSNGLFIEKNTLSNGKTTARKIFISK